MEKSLSGIKVIQLANFVAAAATGRYLADHGADVPLAVAEEILPRRVQRQPLIALIGAVALIATCF